MAAAPITEMRTLASTTLLAAAGWLTGCGSTQEALEPLAPPVPGLESLLIEQTSIYPRMQPADLYKLISQVTHGSRWVFIGSQARLDVGLDAEIAALEPAEFEGETTVEHLCRERNFARINLRPYLQQGGRSYDLARAIAETDRVFEADDAEFHATLRAAGELLETLDVSFGREEFEKYLEQMAKRGYPAGTHSENYALTYDPAYRLVFLQFLADPRYGGRPNLSP